MAHDLGTIVGAVLDGEVARFGELVDRVDGRVRAVVGGAIRDPGAREEVVHETYCCAFRNLGSLGSPEKFGSWIVQIARRCVLDHHRRPAPAPAPEPEAGRTDDHAWIWDEVDGLDPLQAEVIRLRYRRGLTYAEIARRLGVPASTVRGRLYEARRELRRRLAPELARDTRRRRP